MSQAQPPRHAVTGARAPGRRSVALGLRAFILRLRAFIFRLRAFILRLRAWILRLRARRPARLALEAAADRLYGDLVKQARTEHLFRELGVPDTPEGRFEMIGLHAALVMRRLRAEGAAGRALGQALFDLMFANLDAGLRELGVGDLGVGKQVKRLAGQFYARLSALDQAVGGGAAGRPLDGGETACFEVSDQALGSRGAAGRLGAILAANVWRGGTEPSASQVAALADYLIRSERRLGEQGAPALLRGEAVFAPIGERAGR